MNGLKSLPMWCMLACGAMAQTLTVSGRLEEAVVYRTGAELYQTATVVLERGDNEIRLEGVSPVADAGSFRVTLSDGVGLVAHEYTVDCLSGDKEAASVRRLRDSLSVAECRYTALTDESATLTQMLALLTEGVGQSLSAERQKVTNTLIDKGLQYYRQRSADLYAQKAEVEREQAVWKAKVAALKEQLTQETARNAARTGILTMRLNARQACKARVEVRYFTYAASWQPAYEASIASAAGPFVLTSKALLTQTTGLDWEKVALTLSTALPRNGLSAPELDKWLLRREKEYYVLSAKARCNVATMAVAEDNLYMAEAESPVEMAAAGGEAGEGREFVVETPYDIPCNGKPQVIALGAQTLDNISYSRYTAPQMDSRVYLRAQIPDIGRLKLLPGNISVSYKGTYYGEQYINPSSADQHLDLTLGEEPMVAVKRERVEEYSRTKNVANETAVTALYKITLKNNMTEAATVVLKEGYPISGAKEIEVALSGKTTQWQDNDKEKGILTYEIKLQPNETKEVMVGYTVTYPKDWTINFR